MATHWLNLCTEDTELILQEAQGARSWWVKAQEERMWRETPTLTHVGRLPRPGKEPAEERTRDNNLVSVHKYGTLGTVLRRVSPQEGKTGPTPPA